MINAVVSVTLVKTSFAVFYVEVFNTFRDGKQLFIMARIELADELVLVTIASILDD